MKFEYCINLKFLTPITVIIITVVYYVVLNLVQMYIEW